jgi:hypothetical protein
MTKLKEAIGRLGRSVFIMTAIILGVLTVTGCRSGSGTSVPNEAQQLIQQHPWLAHLAFAFLEGLIGAFGWNLGMVLRAAAAALLAG